MSMVLRNLHSTITEEYGLPSWMSYVLFALATIIVGALLGLVSFFFLRSYSLAARGRQSAAPKKLPAKTFSFF